MIVNLATTNVQVIPELNAVNLTITPILTSGSGGGGGDVTKAYVDQQDSLKVDKVSGKGLSTNDFTDELKSQYDGTALNSHTHVNKLVLDNIEVAFTDELNTELTTSFEHSQEIGNPHQTSHDLLRDKNGNLAYQHLDTTTTKETLDEADKVVLYDSMTGKVVLSNALNDIETILASI